MTKVLFLQEYVRENHMKKVNNTYSNAFFQSKAGQILKKLIEGGLGLKRGEYYVDYAYGLVPTVLQRDKYNRAIKYKALKQTETSKEYPHLYKKIVQEKPDIIIPSGNIGCKALLGKGEITKMRGVPKRVTVKYTPPEVEQQQQEESAQDEAKHAQLQQQYDMAQEEREAFLSAYGDRMNDSKALMREYDTILNKIDRIYSELNGQDDTFSSGVLTHECWVLPMNSIENMLINPNLTGVIEADFGTLKKYIDQGDRAFEAAPVEYEHVEDIERVREIFKKDIPAAPITSWDLETNTLKPWMPGAKPLVISICLAEGTGITIPLEHCEFQWLPGHLAEIYELIRDFVADPNIVKVGHNIQFDIRFLRLTKGFTEFNNHRDTKIMYYTLVNQEVESSLKLSDLAYEMTSMGGYDKPLEDFKVKYQKDWIEAEKERISAMKAEYKQAVATERALAKAEKRKPILPTKPDWPKAEKRVNEIDGGNFNYEWIPLKTFLSPYASGDVDACLRIHNKLDEVGKKPENAQIRELYTGHYTELTDALASIEATGVQMDTEYTKNLAEAYTKEEDRLLQQMREFEVVKQLEADNLKLYQIGLAEWTKPPADRDKDIAKLRDKYKDGKHMFNPNSSEHKQKVLFKYTGHKLPFNKEYLVDSAHEEGVPEEEIEWFHYKANKTVLEYMVKNFEDCKDLADLLLTHSLVKTRKQGFTYKLLNMVDPNGRLHGGFNSTGTACVGGDTLLVTSEGIKEIQDLSDNRVEGTFSDIDLTIHSTEGIEKSDGFYYSGTRESRHFTLEDGTELVTSTNHPLLKNMYLSQRRYFNKRNHIFKEHLKNVDWVKAEELKEGDYLALKVGTNLFGNKETLSYDYSQFAPTATSHTKQATLPTVMSEDLAEWLGMYTADGAISTSNGSVNISITNDDDEVLDRFILLTKRLFNLNVGITRPDDRVPAARVSCAHVGKWLMSYIGIKQRAENKDVPTCVLEGTKEVQCAFLRGLTLDSSTQKKKYPSLYLSSVSKKLMARVRVMLFNLGIYCRASIAKPYKERALDLYQVAMSYEDLELFMTTVGLVESCKRKVIEEKFETASKGKRIGTIKSGKYVFVKIKSIEEGLDELFDLHVPKNHSFIGNGVVNHNTSRLASQSPNLQNIPRKTGDVHRFDYHNPIKRMFTTSFENGALLQMDYSSLESRILALAAYDEEMIQAFLDKKDVHRDTASLIHNIPIEEVTDDMRSDAKSTVFGISYGESPFSYHSKHGMTLEQAEKLFSDFFKSKPKIKDYIDATHEVVKEKGEVPCLQGFTRSLRDIYSQDKSKRNGALRQSVNTRIQGSGAFLTNTSVIYIHKFIKQNNMRSRIILTVHDSIVLDCPPEEVHTMAKVAKYVMENLPIPWLYIDWKGERMRFPIVADAEIGVNYNDMVDYDLEEMNTFNSVAGYCKFKLDLKKVKNYRESKVIDEEKEKEMKAAIEASKPAYQSIV
ncbi:DNA polymerase [Bacillus phage Eldridge]|uniref:DNA polymerase n=1 Tax=Bacillus phage Eldridge TaxID=1776293 RepID=A0A120HUP3_9CAUD|nr:DNA polymerase [Bacillus phage Eldridge]AMB18699.1 DNA polymerase [Bacillus phage Eldridge]